MPRADGGYLEGEVFPGADNKRSETIRQIGASIVACCFVAIPTLKRRILTQPFTRRASQTPPDVAR